MADLPNAGDRAQVVHTCECGHAKELLGLIVDVVAVAPDTMVGRCIHCRKFFSPTRRAFVRTGTMEGDYPREWLRRYQPLADLESTDIADELDTERPREQVIA